MRDFDTPGVLDAVADQRFRTLAYELGLDPDHRWTGRYVEHEWHHARHLLDSDLCRIQGKRTLELGCNVGATAVTLALLGADVTAVDVRPELVELARWNAARYGVAQWIRFLHADTERMPFGAGAFDVICCNSVLEYVEPHRVESVLREMDRLLVNGGRIIVTGTSNRLWPREGHTGRWLLHYLPERARSKIKGGAPLRSIAPWTVRSALQGYEDESARDGDRTLLKVKRQMGLSETNLAALAALSRLLTPFGYSAGALMPWMTLVLRKPADPQKAGNSTSGRR